MSRQNNSQDPSPVNPESISPVDRNSDSPAVSSPSPHGHFKRESESSEGYPSWLPRRPPVPAPASTVQSLVGAMHPDSGPVEPVVVGRKPTPRSIRIVSVPDSQNERDGGRREATDQTRAGQPGHLRVWSRATTTGISPTAFSTLIGHPLPVPKFNTNGLNLQLLRNPSPLARLHFYLLPIITFYHIPLQTFFDFNAAFILIQWVVFPFSSHMFANTLVSAAQSRQVSQPCCSWCSRVGKELGPWRYRVHRLLGCLDFCGLPCI